MNISHLSTLEIIMEVSLLKLSACVKFFEKKKKSMTQFWSSLFNSPLSIGQFSVGKIANQLHTP